MITDTSPIDRLGSAKRVRAREMGPGQKIVYETSDAAELESLGRVLRVGQTDGGHCMCTGTLDFEIESAGGLEHVTLHHGESVRWNREFANYPDAIMDWLSARGVTFVREQHDESRRRRAVSQAENARWLSQMPASLAPFFEEMRNSGGSHSPEWTAAIEREFPDALARARVLLLLYGSGGGRWSGYGSCEGVPEHLLLQMPLDLLLGAIGDASDERMREGAARLFSSWDFGKQRAADRALLPAALKRTLLAHVEAEANEDKRARARKALR
jgi:hypothetical protein